MGQTFLGGTPRGSRLIQLPLYLDQQPSCITKPFSRPRTCQPRPLFHSISTDHPRNTRSAANFQIRFGESSRARSTFKYRALQWYTRVPATVKTGSLATVKRKLKAWVKSNVPIDWGQKTWCLILKIFIDFCSELSIILSADGIKVFIVKLVFSRI